MLDRTGKQIGVGDRVRWGSGSRLRYGTVRSLCSGHRGGESCMADDGDRFNPDWETNGARSFATLESREVTKVADAPSADAVERAERAELLRLQLKYGGRSV